MATILPLLHSQFIAPERGHIKPEMPDSIFGATAYELENPTL
jgi:hypothetical protein